MLSKIDGRVQISSNMLRRNNFVWYTYDPHDRLCGPVVRVAGYRFRGPGSIPRATRFSEK
jgi:hypothetical protein